MADEMTSIEWKAFLNARIQQERGDDAGALSVFEDLLSRHPRNQHLLASRTYALSRLGIGEGAQVAKIDAEYSEVGKQLIGEKDDPDAWIERLSKLLNSLEQEPPRSIESVHDVAW